MRRRRAKIERNISLSIQYARLQEEISNAELNILDLNDKKGVAALKKKKIEELNDHIEKIGIEIRDIEANHKPKEYKIIIEDQLDENMRRLSKQKYFQMLKYNFAIDAVLDSSVDYKYSEKFFEYLSILFFNDKLEIKNIQKSIENIYLQFNKDNNPTKAAEVALKISPKLGVLIPMIFKKAKFVPGAMFINMMSFGIGSGAKIIKKRMVIKKMQKLSETDFEYILSTTLLYLLYAKKVLPELENREYFSSKLQVINAARSTILKEFYEESYDVKENLLKIKSLKVFDNYLIEEMKCYI